MIGGFQLDGFQLNAFQFNLAPRVDYSFKTSDAIYISMTASTEINMFMFSTDSKILLMVSDNGNV